MNGISTNNGHTFYTSAAELEEHEPEWLSTRWETLVHYMDADIAEGLNSELAPCSTSEFLDAYLAVSDLIVG